MKHYKSILAIIFLVGVFGLSSCTDMPMNPTEDHGFSVTLPDVNTQTDFVYQDADMNNSMALHPYTQTEYMEMGKGEGMGKPNGKHGLGHHKGDKMGGMKLGRIFKALNLTEEQKALVAGFHQAQMECMKAQREALHAALAPIMEAAKAKREQIIADLKAGTITREEAAAALKALNAETKAAIEASEAMQAARAAMEACRKTFLDSVTGILDETQKPIWEEFLKKING